MTTSIVDSQHSVCNRLSTTWRISRICGLGFSGFRIRAIPSSIGKTSDVSYSIRIKRNAAKELKRLALEPRQRLVEAIDRLASEPLAGSALKGEFSGLRRLRVGDYRIIYEAIRGELTILVVRVGHRSRRWPSSWLATTPTRI